MLGNEFGLTYPSTDQVNLTTVSNIQPIHPTGQQGYRSSSSQPRERSRRFRTDPAAVPGRLPRAAPALPPNQSTTHRSRGRPFLPRKGKRVLKLKSRNKGLCFETGGVNRQRHKAWGKLSFVRTQQKNFFFGGRIFLKNIGMGFSTCCAGNYYLQACCQ